MKGISSEHEWIPRIATAIVNEIIKCTYASESAYNEVKEIVANGKAEIWFIVAGRKDLHPIIQEWYKSHSTYEESYNDIAILEGKLFTKRNKLKKRKKEEKREKVKIPHKLIVAKYYQNHKQEILAKAKKRYHSKNKFACG